MKAGLLECCLTLQVTLSIVMNIAAIQMSVNVPG